MVSIDGFALRELRSALESPKLAGKDETLAACLVLSTYEVNQSSTSLAWNANSTPGFRVNYKFDTRP
jgi:hypothetical protein